MALEIRPLEQFHIERLIPIHIGGLDVSYTNSALLMTVAVALGNTGNPDAVEPLAAALGREREPPV